VVGCLLRGRMQVARLFVIDSGGTSPPVWGHVPPCLGARPPLGPPGAPLGPPEGLGAQMAIRYCVWQFVIEYGAALPEASAAPVGPAAPLWAPCRPRGAPVGPGVKPSSPPARFARHVRQSRIGIWPRGPEVGPGA